MIKKILYKAGLLLVLLSLALPYVAFAQDGDLPEPEVQPVVEEAQGITPFSPTDDVRTFTVFHTNDFHGQLEPSGSNPGMARLAYVLKQERAAVGITNTLTLDAGDEMQGSLLSNLQKGAPVIDVFNTMTYTAATLGNHEFDWGQQVLISRTLEADYPYVAANLVVKDTVDCATAGWTSPSFVTPWITKTVETPTGPVVVGIIGVTSTETPYITIAAATNGLCFKDPKASILHYYDQVKAVSDVIIALTHIGNTDGGYGYGFPVTGDQTLAKDLIAAGKPVNLIVGGHSHTNLAAAQVFTGTVSSKVVKTWVAQAYYNGRNLGKAVIAVNKTTGDVNVTWSRLSISTSGAKDPTIDALITTYTSDPAYQAKINQVIGFTNVPLMRNYNGDSLMAELVDDAVYNDLNHDLEPLNDVDMFFQNAGGIRADITSTVGYPYTLTYGSLFTVLPFGNATIVGTMTGAQVVDLLNQSATLFKGALQPSGIRYKFYHYNDAGGPPNSPWAWGAYDIQVWNKTTSAWEPIDANKTYKVGTNEFLAPAGHDGYIPFKYFTNGTYWGDMLNQVNHWISMTHGTRATAWNGPDGTGVIDNRIWRNGGDTYNGLPTEVIPITILHHNDSHGNMVKGTYVGYTQLATLIKQERAHNPNRTLLLNAGDSIQGDSMMYYFRTAALGYASDGTALPAALQMNPLIKAYNLMGYDAMTLGNHEFNFGHQVFTSTLRQANFPILQANLSDSGAYGLDEVPVEPYVTKNVGGVKVAILGIGNHRVPNYELPSNIPGLTFTNPISTALQLVPQLKSENDVVIALTHIGFTSNPKSVEVDNNVDTVLAAEVSGIDAIIGSHSHTDPSKKTDASGAYQYLPAMVGNPDNTAVLINQAYRYNNYLGEVVLGVLPKSATASGEQPASPDWVGYDVVSRVGRNIKVNLTDAEDAQIKAVVDPYSALLAAYNSTTLGKTTVPIDARSAFTQETNGANLQADASVAELVSHGITPDFHLSGAMTNQWVASTATITNPYTLTVANMFTLMPYENSLVVLRMNGPQLKAVLERAYRNYYYYKYVPGYGGYSYYTTCMLDTNAGNQIRYHDTYPLLPNGNNVEALVINGVKVDFNDATKYYKVSTVNYLAAGSCNFNNGGVSLWPLNQIVNDTQYYVRDAVINYIKAQGTVSPAIEGRLLFSPLTLKDFLPLFMR